MNRDTLHAYAMGMLSAGAEPTREDLAAFAANVECDDNGDARELGVLFAIQKAFDCAIARFVDGKPVLKRFVSQNSLDSGRWVKTPGGETRPSKRHGTLYDAKPVKVAKESPRGSADKPQPERKRRAAKPKAPAPAPTPQAGVSVLYDANKDRYIVKSPAGEVTEHTYYREAMEHAARLMVVPMIGDDRPLQVPPTNIAQKASRFEYGKNLTREQKKQILASVSDVYKENGLGKTELKGVHRESGDEIYGYPHSPELFVTSDITGAKIRHYITLTDGRKAHPSEMFPNIKQSDIDKHIASAEHSRRANKRAASDRESRVATTRSDANSKYNATNRGLSGSYFARDASGRWVRVDGSDSTDVAHYEAAGFKRVSPIIA